MLIIDTDGGGHAPKKPALVLVFWFWSLQVATSLGVGVSQGPSPIGQDKTWRKKETWKTQ